MNIQTALSVLGGTGLNTVSCTTGNRSASTERRKRFVGSVDSIKLSNGKRKRRDRHPPPLNPPPPPATFGEWIKHWFETYRIPHISAQSKDRSQSIINKHILPALGSIPLNKLNHDNLQTFLNGFIATPNSQKKIYDIIHGSLEKCRVSGKIKTNPADGLTVKRYTKKKRKALQVAEQLAMFEYLETRDPKYAKLAMFSCCTGIRIGRVVELTDKDVDHERGEIIVKMKQKLGLEETYRVPFLPELLDGLPTKGKLFPDINISAAQDFFKRVFNKLKIEDVTIHSFRHTFVSMLYHIGVSLKQIQELAGHKTLSITADVYTHIIKNSGDSPILNYLKRLKEFLNI